MVLSILHNSDTGINRLLQECSKRVTRHMHTVEENSSLMEDMMSLDKLGEALTEQLIDWIYFEQSWLVLAQGGIKVVHRLRSSGTNSNEGCRVVQWHLVEWEWDQTHAQSGLQRNTCDVPSLLCTRFRWQKTIGRGSHSGWLSAPNMISIRCRKSYLCHMTPYPHLPNRMSPDVLQNSCFNFSHSDMTPTQTQIL